MNEESNRQKGHGKTRDRSTEKDLKRRRNEPARTLIGKEARPAFRNIFTDQKGDASAGLHRTFVK
jgi:hypothetical protein